MCRGNDSFGISGKCRDADPSTSLHVSRLFSYLQSKEHQERPEPVQVPRVPPEEGLPDAAEPDRTVNSAVSQFGNVVLLQLGQEAAEGPISISHFGGHGGGMGGDC